MTTTPQSPVRVTLVDLTDDHTIDRLARLFHAAPVLVGIVEQYIGHDDTGVIHTVMDALIHIDVYRRGGDGDITTTFADAVYHGIADAALARYRAASAQEAQ